MMRATVAMPTSWDRTVPISVPTTTANLPPRRASPSLANSTGWSSLMSWSWSSAIMVASTWAREDSIVAYRTATEDALSKAVIEEKFVEERITYRFTYPMINAVMRVVKETGARIVSQSFDNDCEIVLSIRQSLAEGRSGALGQTLL